MRSISGRQYVTMDAEDDWTIEEFRDDIPNIDEKVDLLYVF